MSAPVLIAIIVTSILIVIQIIIISIAKRCKKKHVYQKLKKKTILVILQIRVSSGIPFIPVNL